MLCVMPRVPEQEIAYLMAPRRVAGSDLAQ